MRKIILMLLLFTTISNAQWVRMPDGMGNNVTVSSLTAIGSNIFAGTRNYGVFLSTNNGLNWAQTSLSSLTITSLAVSGNSIYAGNFGVYVSSNNGTNWSFCSLYNRAVYSLAISSNFIFAGTADYNNIPFGICLSMDNGVTWSQTSLNNRFVYSMAIKGNNVYAGTGDPGNGVYMSTNMGEIWTQTTLNNRDIRSLAVNGNYVFVGTYDHTGSNPHGVYLSTNNGTSWTQSTLNNTNVWTLLVSGNNLFAGCDYGNDFYQSSDNGASWIPRNEGLENHPVLAIYVMGNYIYAGTFNYGVYRRPISELVGIQPISNENPKTFSLSQNYPNPFNPSTKIRFEVPLTKGDLGGFVKLTIYDALGKEVTTLVNEQLQPGTYEVTFDGANLPSGVYFYKIQAGEFKVTKKMILTK